MFSYKVALLLLGCTVRHASALGRKLQASSCNFDTVFSLRSEWQSIDEPCHKKLPFELWTLMKAEGSAQSSDALHVRENCIQTTGGVGLLELITPKGYTMSESVEAAPGDVVSETEHATTYQGATATTFEAFCEDEEIVRVTRVSAHLEAFRSVKRKPGRRLQSTTSEGGQAHEVAELIAGLADLGCTRTMGEDQTVCVMSDSFDQLGSAADLQALGDLPQVEVVKELPLAEGTGIDEGSAMLEIMYDIAPGATYKFNTGFLGEQTFADDVTALASEEMCDVIVDDVAVFESPAYRDGMIAVAVDGAVDSGGLHFTSAGNSGYGWRFMSNFECATGFEAEFEQTPACGTGVATHVFQPEETGPHRYMYPLFAESDEETFLLHWDEDMGTTQDVLIALWVEVVSTGEMVFIFFADEFSGEKSFELIGFTTILLDDDVTPDPSYRYHLQIVHLGPDVGDIDAEFFLVNPRHEISGESDPAIYGHKCASGAITVAAMNWAEGDGLGGAFEDPETSPVESFSSRGPCVVDGETRAKPTTTAADGVTTSNAELSEFFGTSAAAPAAGAIASIVRAACFPKVVGHAEMMEMLSNYDYTIDLTSDADGAAETWGPDGGYGIISASQMLAWVAANCGEACPGAASPQATEEPVVPTAEPTAAATPETPAGQSPAPVAPTTTTPSPVAPPTPAPAGREEPKTPAPAAPEHGYVEAGTETTVSVTATAWDERLGSASGDSGCGESGCLPELAHDGVGEEDVESRWSCSTGIVPDGGQCDIEFTFGSPQDIMDVEVDFFKGDERARTLQVKLDEHAIGEYESSPGSISTSLGITQDGVETVTLSSIGLGEDEWISLLEVRFMVEP